MTEPTSQFFTPDLAAAYTKVLGSHPVFTTRPNVAAALAMANPDRGTLEVVGGFLQSLDLAKQVRGTRAGGGKIVLSAEDRGYLDLLGEDYSDVDATPVIKQIDQAQQAGSALSKAAPAQTAGVAGVQVPEAHGAFGHVAAFLKGAAHLAADAADAPGIHQALGALNTAADATRGAVRVGEYGLSKITPDFLDPMDPGRENDREMRERGYDPSNPVSVLAFFASGKQNYNKLDDLRDKYGDGSVKAAQDYLEHPESFDVSANFDDSTNVARIQALNDPRWQEILKQVDSRHQSIGRELALGLHLDPTKGNAFHRVSGGLDAVESWFIDPTIIGGKLAKAHKLNKLAINSLTDESGIRRVLANNADVKRGWQALLDDAKVTREGSDVEKGVAYARIRTRSPELLPLVDEINGKVPNVVNHTAPLAKGVVGPERLVKSTVEFTHQAPIEDMAQLTEYLVSKNALVRTLRGAAPKTGVYMPGSVSRFAAGKAQAVGALAARTGANHEDRIIDLSKDAARVLPTPGNAAGGPMAEATVRGKALAADAKSLDQGAFRARFLSTAKRLSTLVPNETSTDFYAPGATDLVYKWGAATMPKAEARMLAAKFSAADLAGRRTIYKSMMEQAIHSTGLESSATGRELAAKMRGDLAKADQQSYSLADDADLLTDGAGTRRVAVFPGQVSTEMWLPAFKNIQKAAAKVSLYDHTLKRVADNTVTEKIMQTLRAGWLFTSAGAVRNIMEGWAGAAASGMGWPTFKAKLALSSHKATARALERELPAGVFPAPTEAAYHKARLGRVLSGISKAKGSTLARFSSDELDEAARIMGEEIAQGHVTKLGLSPTALITGVADPHNLEDLAAITKLGARPAEVAFKQWEQKGWGEVASEGEAGARNWAHNLDQIVGETPGLARLLVGTVRTVDKARATSIVSEFGKEKLARYIVASPEMAKYREFAELAKPLREAATDEIRLEAARSIADRMISSFDALVTGRDDKPLHKLLDRLESGQVPSLEWLGENIPSKLRPEKVIGRQWAAVPVNPDRSGLAGLGQMLGKGYTDFLSKGYEVVVSGPISRMANHPIFVGNLVKARRNLAGYEQKLIDEGLSPESARLHSTKLALGHALDMTARMIDNPEVASQAATMSRNLINFPRAAEDWVRRWARITKEDPTLVRKAQMAIEGGQHAGIIDRDDQGNLIFTYPGSGAVINAMLKVGEALHIPHMASLPTVPDLKSNVLFLNPSLNNPFFPGASPLIVTPLKVAQGFFPESKLMLQDLQTGLTGDDRGAGQSVMSQFFPSIVKNMFKALTADETDAQLSSAMKNAIVHLDAAGLDPDSVAAKAGRTPSPQDREDFLARVRIASRNQLVLRAIFGFALPATPGIPENEVSGGNEKSDAIFQAQGISTLKDEMRTLVSKLGYERALSIWTKLHPDELAYTVSGTKLDSPYSSVPVTRSAELWVEGNLDFVKKYPKLAAYFIPDSPGDFSPEAYRAQLELGIRHRKGLEDFYGDVRTISAERTYYEVRDRRDKEIAKAKAVGDSDGVARARAIWTSWSQGDGTTGDPGFLNLNPLFAAKLASYGERTVWREQAIGDLDKLVQSGLLGNSTAKGGDTIDLGKPGSMPVDQPTSQGIADFIQAFHSHDAFTKRMAGRRDKDAVQAKDNEQRAYEKHMLGITGAAYDAAGRLTGGNSALRDIYQGLFRGLD